MGSNLDYALQFAVARHAGQVRKSTGIPYIIHPLEVLKQIKIWGVNDPYEFIEQAAILHDILEDTSATEIELKIHFDPKVVDIIKELTFKGDKQEKGVYLSSFPAKSWQAHLIKVADRLCNVRDFLLTDSRYALIYLRKADQLFQDFSWRDDVSKELISKVREEHSKVYAEIARPK